MQLSAEKDRQGPHGAKVGSKDSPGKPDSWETLLQAVGEQVR